MSESRKVVSAAPAPPSTLTTRWSEWSGQSSHRRVLAAGLTVGLFTGLVQVASLLKEVIVAGRFGTGDQLDAFFIAYLLPAFGINVLGWSLNSALVPAFLMIREKEGAAAAHAVLEGVTARMLALLLALSAMLALAFPMLVRVLASSFSASKLELTTTLFFLILPSLTCSAVTAIWSGILNAHDDFGIAAAVPGLVPVAIVAAVFLFPHMGVYSIAGALTAGTALQCFVLGSALRRRGISVRPRWGALTPGIRDVFRQYAPAVGGALLASSTTLVDQSMSAMLPPGSVATFNYGSKLVGALLGIGMVAIGTAVLPQFSRLAAKGQWAELREALRRYTLLLLAALIPLTFVLVVFAEPIVRLVFERGAFAPADTRRVAFIQQLFALQIPFYLVGILVVRLISALRRNDILLWGAVGNVVLNVALNYVLMKPLGVAGIALSTTFVYLVAASGLGIVLWRLIGRLEREAA